MLIPESILEPFGYTGIPLVRIVCDPEVIEGTLNRLFGHLYGLSNADMCYSMEAAVLILGANAASCQHVNLDGEHDQYLLGFIMHNSTEVRHLTFD